MNIYIDRLIKGLKNPIKGVSFVLGKGWRDDKVESALLKKSPIDIVVHVGGHLAQELDLYRSLGVQHIIWLEADPSTFVKLQDKLQTLEAKEVKKIKHTVINATISDTDDKEVDFYVFNNKGGSSSIKKPTNLLFETYSNLSVIGDPLKLKTSRLDTILSSINFSRYSKKSILLVLDIQGNEGPALEGLGKYHEMFTMIQSEISQLELYEGSTMFSEIDEWMKKRGFKLFSHSYSYVPWHGDLVYSKES